MAGWQDAPIIEAKSSAKSAWESAPLAEDVPDPTGSFGENVKASIGKVFVDLGRGAGQIARDILTPSYEVHARAQGMEPLPNAADAVGLPTQVDIDQARELDRPLMATAGGKVGSVVGGAALAAPTVLLPGANTVTGAGLVGGAIGVLQPTATGESRALNTALGTTIGAATQWAGGKIAGKLQDRATQKAADIATLKAQQAPRDMALEAGRRAGYVVPPSTTKPGLVNEAVESVAGKISTAQVASVKNQKVTDSLARKALGLKEDALLTEGSLADLRRQAGKAYKAIKDVPGKFRADPQFMDDVANIGNDFAAAAEVVPSSVKNEALDALKADLTKGEWSPKGLMEAIRKLRFDASKNYKSFDDPSKAALADAQRSAAEALEGLIERNLDAQGKGSMVDAFRRARVLIAKSHDIDAALTPDGHVNAQVLAKIAQKKPFTDELATIADFAGSFPKAVQPPSKVGGAGVHALRPSIGAGVGTLVGGPGGAVVGGAAGVAVPWLVRAGILSPVGQALLTKPSYSGTAVTGRISDLLSSRAAKAALPPATVGAVLNYRAQQ